MERNAKHLKARIMKLRKAIKNKYKRFKEGTVESELSLEKQYKPLIEEMRKSTNDVIKTEPEEEIKNELQYDTTDDEQDMGLAAAASSPQSRDSSAESDDSITRHISQYFPSPLTREYMEQYMRDQSGAKHTMDYTYGPYYNNSTLYVGNKRLQFTEDGSIKVGNVVYKPTRGLYELLFKRAPEGYDNNDLETYKDILIDSSAHKHGYRYRGNINRTRSPKYTLVIKHLFPPPVRGSGAMRWKSSDTRDIVHWDDPNELIGRLRHLIVSTETGNKGHKNEIINIIEELKEAGYIKGPGNSRYTSLLK